MGDGRTDERKYAAFLAAAAMLNRQLGVTPLLFGSLGLEQRLGVPLAPDDIDVLLPERWLTGDWRRTAALMGSMGYGLVDEHEHEFANGDLRIAFAAIESLEPFAGVDINHIPLVRDQDAEYLLLTLPDYLKVYEASSRDGYRKNVKNKQDQRKTELIRKALKEGEKT